MTKGPFGRLRASLFSARHRNAERTIGNPEAQYRLGRQRLSAIDPAHSPVEAVQWLGRAAEQGHALAQHDLSLVLLGGLRSGGPAATWLAQADQLPQGLSTAALLYPEGRVVAPDVVAAFSWAQAAAGQGLACAQANFGMLHLRGVGCERNFTLARDWFERAAKQHDPVGQLGLGLLYEYGLGVEQDQNAALRWYRLADRPGPAQTTLGALLKRRPTGAD